ncbi:MAG: outer membrane beta-barrel domain-containing protein [Bdellovibrionota bacterium]
MRILFALLVINAGLVGPVAIAQTQVPTQAQAQEPPLPENIDDQEIINIENLYRSKQVQQEIRPSVKSLGPTSEQEQQIQLRIKNNADVQDSRIKSLTDLNKLAPFSDISVIQKKFLPKTERFQLYAAGGMTTNSPWFLNIGAKVNLAYHFTESFGIEASGMFLSSSETEAAKEIRANNSLQPDKFVITKYNMLLDLVWSPIYGKVSNLDSKIIPFDMYFSFGGGLSGTNSQEKTVPTFHIGTGQIFALSKSMAFRWDYSWNLYQATPVVDAGATSAPAKSNYNDLIFTAGLSFFFPEASYR